ncbi:MAG: nitroreductase family deazaflavin-dependent oxidoreductase [Thermomicrobiales bacterium]
MKTPPATGGQPVQVAGRASVPRGALRWALRLPIRLYHANLGWLFGHQFLLLAHQGRRSGQRRETVLEVVRYDRQTHLCIVVSAWGERADWLRNIRARPALEVRIGHERFVPDQRLLSPVEVEAELAAYARRYPWRARVLPHILGWGDSAAPTDLRDFAAALRMVAFRPRLARR